MTDPLKQQAEIWAPNYPRKCAGKIGPKWGQVDAYGPEELVHNLKQVSGQFPGYVSTYSFPDGHPSEGNIPKIDTLMIDFDFDFNKDQFNYDEWQMKLGDLLTRVRMIARELVDRDYDKYWRGSLSGYKGVHLYLDFPPIRENLGTETQYRNGMENFTDEVIDSIIAETSLKNLEEYIDVTSGWDLSRLTRLPNTIHEKATKQFEETRYCVPISLKEMREIDVPRYVALTKDQRMVPEYNGRFPNNNTRKVAERFIKTATKEEEKDFTPSVKDPEKYEHYTNNVVNERVELEDLEFLLNRKPCVWNFHLNPKKFDYGKSSHDMEIQSILVMKSIGTPIDVMHEFFAYHPTRDVHPNYDKAETQKQIEEILSREYGEFNCSSILEDSPQFCMKQDCKIYRDDKSLQQIH